MLLQKNFFYILAAAALAVLLGGCGGPEISSEGTKGAAQTERLDPAAADIRPEGSVPATETSSGRDSDALEIPEEESSLPIAVSLPGDYIEYIVYSEGRYCYRDDSLYGYLAEDGSEITPCIYTAATPFSQGLACVCLDGKYGYIGKDGETVLPFVYDQASPFREGRAYFSRGEEYGLIDRESCEEMRLEGYESISSFREGLAYFCRDGLYGYMDRDGQEVIEPVYDDVGYFYDGLAVVRKNGLCGVIGREGGEILPCRYETVNLEENYIFAERENLKYCFDRAGRELLSGAWYYMWEEDGMFWARNRKNERYVLADSDGKILMDTTEYRYPRLIPGRDLLVAQDADGRYGILDYEGRIIVPFQYKYICNTLHEGGFRYTDANTGKVGYLDGEDFSIRIPAIYDSIGEFVQGRAVISYNEKDGICGLDGVLELSCEYDKIRLYDDGSMAVWRGENATLTDRQGNLILEGPYVDIDKWGNGYQTWEEVDAVRHRYSYWDMQGNLIVSDYDYGSKSVEGAKDSYILDRDILLITGQECGRDIEEVLLRNQITPETGVFAELLKNGSMTVQDASNGHITEIGELERYEHVFCKLYRMGEEKVLYFHAAPWERPNFPESHSGLFTVRNGEVTQLLGEYECGGSMRGDYVCFVYDREQERWKPGVKGSLGGFGGFLTNMEVYALQDGEAVREVSFNIYSHSRYDYEEEELLENAGVFYDDEDNPYTAETILECTDNVTEYLIDDKWVTVEEYRARTERYRTFLPLDLSW